MVWENPNMATAGQGYVGFAIKGDGVNNFIAVVILHGPTNNVVGIYKFTNGSLSSLTSATLTTSDNIIQTNIPAQLECEFYGKFLTVKINGKKVLDKYTHSDFLNAKKVVLD
jgi:hypothetical protein